MNLPVEITHRPFSVEKITGLMLPDGIFDGALFYQSINCYITNTSQQDLTGVQIYMEGIGDPGIVPRSKTVQLPLLRAGESVLCSWDCDFSQSSPGKTLLSIRVQSAGFQPARILRKIFVSRTLYNRARGEYVCQVPEGTLRLGVIETSGPPVEYQPGPGSEPIRKRNPGPWLIRRFTAEVEIGFTGQYGPLAFNDPWWKIVAWIVAVIAAIVAVILASQGHGTASGGVECDYDEKTGTRSNCRMPDGEPTTGPTETTPASIASAVASTAVTVGLADDVDPWRRGQAATPVAQNERTLSEKLEVNLVPLDDLEAGKPFGVRCTWLYTRTTDKGVYNASGTDDKKNTHLLGSKKLIAPGRVAVSQASVPVKAVLTRPDGSSYRGQELYVTFIARPPAGQGGEFRTVLTDPGSSGEYAGAFPLDVALGQMRERHENFIGVWRLYVIAQDVNLAPQGLSPEQAAQIIGGFPIAGFSTVSISSVKCPVLTADALMEVYM
ncbi:hypothetical protein ACQR2B_27985 [Bradyrhizobium oligotrophicum]|uniref:hypothetical protein n=1 Tax=Bradyrhizobium TaxID=374 RepID=UPI003EBC02B9